MLTTDSYGLLLFSKFSLPEIHMSVSISSIAYCLNDQTCPTVCRFDSTVHFPYSVTRNPTVIKYAPYLILFFRNPCYIPSHLEQHPLFNFALPHNILAPRCQRILYELERRSHRNENIAEGFFPCLYVWALSKFLDAFTLPVQECLIWGEGLK